MDKSSQSSQSTHRTAQPSGNGDEELIKKFMSERDYPNWYRGLSPFQLAAADSLLTSIRDDSEQGTSHRVRDDLLKLGIEPLVGHRKIKLAMRLSRGNDLAFLWFLMELYYSYPKDTKGGKPTYTVNQQLIISAISHLDTVPTLRELDKLLPKASEKPRRKKIRIKKPPRPHYILPYFERQTRPMFWGKKLTVAEADTPSKLGRYESFLNPNYVVANECNRWFAHYELNVGNRIAKRIIDDQIELAVDNAESGVFHEVNPIFCAQHASIRALKQQILEELRVARKKACEKHFDMEGKLKDGSYKRVIEMLDSHIAETELDFQKLQRNIDKGLMSRDPEERGSRSTADGQDGTVGVIRLSMDDDQNANTFDYGHAVVPNEKTKYFHAPSCNKPFKFDYNNIFDLGPKDLISDAVRTALTGHSSGDVSINNNRAVKECCKEMWDEEVKKFKKEYNRAERERKKNPPPPPDPYSKFTNTRGIDPRDKKKINSLLHAAIKELRKDKKFVLATLPDAHKAPVLKEWLKKRYGIIYTRKEKRDAFSLSRKVFHVMKKTPIHARLPILDDLATNRSVSYACQKYLLRKTTFLRNNYYHNFKENFLEHARVYWGAARPYQCSNGPPSNEFFAYLPARENDIYMFRPWRLHEFIPAKEQWVRRQKAKRAESQY